MQKPISLFLAACLFVFAAEHPPQFTITPDIRASLDSISPDSMRGNLSFLASDLLQGRDTPSPGLDIAAEFIAAQFRKARLEPGGDNGYFQTAHLVQQEPDFDGFSLTLTNGEHTLSAAPGDVQLRLNQPLEIASAPIFKLDLNDTDLTESLTAEQLSGKVVITELSRGAMRTGRKVMNKLRPSKAVLLIVVERKASDRREAASPQVFDPDDRETSRAPGITIAGKAAAAFYDGLKPGLSKTATAAVHVAAPKQKPLVLRNVVAILRGSDPALRNTCVLLTAHYDHIGVKPNGDGDRIYNGANDDGSGTVSVIEIAAALAKLTPHPLRTIVFATFFGEEKGGYGSRYYTRHPAIPLKDTVADVNLEQVGRTDSTEGPQVATASITGADYSDVPEILRQAGALTGVNVYKHPQNSDLYFGASDNLSFAEKGVPAHTLAVAFNYPDYHGVGDEWPKIDYDNMAKVDRTVEVGVLMLANSTAIPHWNPNNSHAAAYEKTWQANHAP